MESHLVGPAAEHWLVYQAEQRLLALTSLVVLLQISVYNTDREGGWLTHPWGTGHSWRRILSGEIAKAWGTAIRCITPFDN